MQLLSHTFFCNIMTAYMKPRSPRIYDWKSCVSRALRFSWQGPAGKEK